MFFAAISLFPLPFTYLISPLTRAIFLLLGFLTKGRLRISIYYKQLYYKQEHVLLPVSQPTVKSNIYVAECVRKKKIPLQAEGKITKVGSEKAAADFFFFYNDKTKA